MALINQKLVQSNLRTVANYTLDLPISNLISLIIFLLGAFFSNRYDHRGNSFEIFEVSILGMEKDIHEWILSDRGN